MPRKNPENDFHDPYTLGNDWKTKTDKVARYVSEDGMKINEALTLVFGVHKRTWDKWRRWALEDYENGFTGTRLQTVVTKLSQADMEAGRFLSRKARDLALKEDNVEMLKFLLERRHGYKKESKKDVEVSTKDDFNFNINITDSKKE